MEKIDEPKGLAIIVTVLDGKSKLKIRNNCSSLNDLTAAITYLEVAKKDLLKVFSKQAGKITSHKRD